jgi:hypothetical protein
MTLEVTEYDVPNEDGTTGPRLVTKSSEYVRVSASNVPRSGPETYIFLANDQGEPINWLECEGSYRGGYDHNEALNGANYKIVGNPKRVSLEYTTDCLTAALNRTIRLQRRMIGWHSAIINATKNADRIVLANDADSVRLDLEILGDLLQEAQKYLRQEDVDPRDRCNM